MNYMDYNNIQVIDRKKGYAELEVEITEVSLNTRGYVHGGLYFSLSDSAAGVAAHSLGGDYVTLDANIHYLKAAYQGRLKAQAKVISESNKIILVNVDIFNDTELVATARVSMYRLKSLKYQNGYKEDKVNIPV